MENEKQSVKGKRCKTFDPLFADYERVHASWGGGSNESQGRRRYGVGAELPRTGSRELGGAYIDLLMRSGLAFSRPAKSSVPVQPNFMVSKQRGPCKTRAWEFSVEQRTNGRKRLEALDIRRSR